MATHQQIETEGPSPVAAAPKSPARRAFESTLIVVATVVGALALWKLRLLVALLLAGMTLAAAMRPGVDALARHRVPRAVGVILHYLVLLGAVALFLSFAVPRLTTEVQAALAVKPHAHPSGGIKARILNDLARELHHLPAAGKLIHPALSIGEKALEVLLGIVFTFTAAAYWLFERDRAVDFVCGLIARPRRKTVRDTWLLIDQKLGAFIRGQLLMIVFVSTLASALFAVVGEPYWLLLGIATGVLEIIPVVGPTLAVVLAAGAGLTVSWHVAALAAGGLLVIRLFQDYFLNPRVLGGAVGLPPLVVLVSVFGVGLLFGAVYVLLAVPLAALTVTIVDVVVRGCDPAEAEVPAVLFTPSDTESD